MDKFLDFPDIQKYCENVLLTHTNRDGVMENFQDHFKFYKSFDYKGSQGKAGILEVKRGKDIEKIVYKISLDLDHVVKHESYIISKMKGIRKWCPHFFEGIGQVKCPLSFDYKVRECPFAEKDENKVYLDVLLTEYIPRSIGLTEKILNLKSRNLYSIIRQVLIGVEMAKRALGFVHYDLHTDNILLQTCPKDSLFLYNLGDRKICIPTYGIYPVIIDYGFAYLKGMKDYPLYTSMNNTDAGYLACLYDPYFDYRVFLVSISFDMANGDPKYAVFRKKVLALYSSMQINEDRGWDSQKGEYSASDFVIYTLKDIEKEDPKSVIFQEETSDCCRMIQSLITLPLVNKQNGNMKPFYTLFINEFKKLETCTKTKFNKMFILFTLIDALRKFQDKIRNDENKEAQTEAVRECKKTFYHQLSYSLKFFVPSNDIDYFVMLENLLKVADCIGTIYFRVMKDLIAKKQDQYQHQEDNLEIYSMIETYFGTEYSLTENTPVYVWDIEARTHKIYNSFTTEQCLEFNETLNKKRGDLLWKYTQATTPLL